MGVLALRSIEQGNRAVSILHGGSKNCWQAVTRLTSGPWLLDTLKWPLNFLLMMCYRCIFWLHAIKQVHHDSYPTASFCNTPEKRKKRERERDVYIIFNNSYNSNIFYLHPYLVKWSNLTNGLKPPTCYLLFFVKTLQPSVCVTSCFPWFLLRPRCRAPGREEGLVKKAGLLWIEGLQHLTIKIAIMKSIMKMYANYIDKGSHHENGVFMTSFTIEVS